MAGLHEFGLSHTFPSAQAVSIADLSELGLTRTRGRAIQALAHAVLGGAIRLDRSVPLEHLIASITAVPGLGPWTAHYLALRVGEPDAFPAGDHGLSTALRSPGSPPSRSLEALAETWRPWRASAAIQLWVAPTSPTGGRTLEPAASF